MKNIKSGFVTLILFTILTGVIYPLFITLIAQLFLHESSNGSLIKVEEKIVGSKLIGQNFTSPKYFYSRPSSIDYKGSISGATNLGPTSKKLIQTTEKRIKQIKDKHDLPDSSKIPADLALSSASGLDPHISPESAYLQAKRVSENRNISQDEIESLITENIERPTLGFIGKNRVNVLNLNLELNKLSNTKQK